MEMEWAKEFLLERLQAGPVKSNDILDEARQKGIAEKILKQAKKDLGVKWRQVKKGAGHRGRRLVLGAADEGH